MLLKVIINILYLSRFRFRWHKMRWNKVNAVSVNEITDTEWRIYKNKQRSGIQKTIEMDHTVQKQLRKKTSISKIKTKPNQKRKKHCIKCSKLQYYISDVYIKHIHVNGLQNIRLNKQKLMQKDRNYLIIPQYYCKIIKFASKNNIFLHSFTSLKYCIFQNKRNCTFPKDNL